ncbi:MAG: pyridoxamine 5'-phosphate oxidase family protein [Candidatus Omnitrophica bacterium]|nr:pyridoxamine 5'-phosphate oxidase family protein [Candidatus Omnitrophota bacterium]
MKLGDGAINFFQNQGYVIVTTIDKDGTPHSSCKGIVNLNKNGSVYLLDLYKSRTYSNLKNNPKISLTAVDEHRFQGYCLKGKARIITSNNMSPDILRAWQDKITSRLTQRVLKNIHEQKGHPRHPEVLLPKPKYAIVMEVKEVVDLTPHNLK